MSRYEKLLKRLLTIPKDFKYSELKVILEHLGFKEYSKGKTSGSRMKFFRETDNRIILVHKPHPTDQMSIAAVEDVVKMLTEIGEL